MESDTQIPNAASAGDSATEVRFSAEEEKRLLAESHDTKQAANSLFSSGELDSALEKYADALESCPNYNYYERAVLHGNVAACHLKLEVWEKAIKASTASLDDLEKYEVELGLKPKPAAKASTNGKAEAETGQENDQESQYPSFASQPDAASDTDVITAAPSVPDATKKDILRIRTKALLRRGKARSQAGGWQNLSGATEDYKTLSAMKGLTPADKRTVDTQLRALPSRTKAAQETETAEMWGKLRHLGDGILKPFGLSTNNFQMVQDPSSGGYSVNFTQGDKKGGQA